MSKCDHDLAVRQDPQSGAHELLFCTKGCGLEPKRRVSAAESIRARADEQLAAAHQRIEGLVAEVTELQRGQETDRAELLGQIETLTKLSEVTNQRLKNLEASQLPIAVGA